MAKKVEVPDDFGGFWSFFTYFVKKLATGSKWNFASVIGAFCASVIWNQSVRSWAAGSEADGRNAGQMHKRKSCILGEPLVPYELLADTLRRITFPMFPMRQITIIHFRP